MRKADQFQLMMQFYDILRKVKLEIEKEVFPVVTYI